MEIFAIALFLGGALFGTLLYIAPTLIAWSRGHHNAGAIAALNVLFGWTAIGWVGAMVWALTATEARERAVQHHHWHGPS